MRLRTKLIASYALVVLLAIVAAGALALPLFQDYQNRLYEADLQRTIREKSLALDQTVRKMLVDSKDAPFRDAFPKQNATGTGQIWPTENPPIEAVREAFGRAAQNGMRVLVVRPRLNNERLVLVDTEPDPAKSWVGAVFPVGRAQNVVITPTPATNSGTKVVAAPTATPTSELINNTRYFYEQFQRPSDNTTYYLIFRQLSGSGPNLFGLNQQGKPAAVIYATIFPAPPPPDVFEDMLGSFALAGLVALVISLVAGLLLARSLSRPLVRLTQASEAIAKGDYSHTVPPEGGYELARLAESFNYMSDEIEEYQRMQRELIGNVSHELKTPLTTIRGFSQAMLDGALRRPEDFASSAEIIHGETERMIRLVNSLLDLSRLESGQVQMARDELDLVEILDKAVTGFGPRAQAAEIKLVGQFDPVPLILGDADRLRQVFNNLIDNALKYTLPGGQITVSCRSNGRSVVASVADSGVGIPEADLGHIFERFYQTNKARSREVEGIGLGLAITREIILAHKGKIEAQSKVGQGTCFMVMLPALPPTTTPPSKQIPVQAEEREKAVL